MAIGRQYSTPALLNVCSDLDVCVDLNLPTNLAGTEKIIGAAAKAVKDRNIKDMIMDGYPPEQAEKIANKEYSAAMKFNRELCKKNKLPLMNS